MKCSRLTCKREALDNWHLCVPCDRKYAHRTGDGLDYEAARLDPTTDRDRWDVWDDGGLEGPGGDEW